MCENLNENKHCIKNVIGSEDILMHKAERPSNYFFPTISHVIRLSR